MPRLVFLVIIFLFTMLLSGACRSPRLNPGLLASATATPTHEPIPTFTPTTVHADAPTAVTPPPEDALPDANNTPVGDDDDATSASTQEGEVILLPTATSTSPEPATPASAQLSVISESVNVRLGPGTEYAPIDVVAQGAQFAVTGRNEAGDWWQVCCFEGQSGWLYGPLVEVQNTESIALAADIPPTPVIPPTSVPVPQQKTPAEPQPQEPAPETEEPAPVADSGTAGNFDPDAQYQIVHYRTLGFDDNNGGIFNKGGQQIIFVTVLDQNGNGVDGAVIKDAVGDKLNVSVGSKGPGKAEIKMDWDPYKIYVAADPSGAVTSQISNQMNNPYPHIPDVIGRLGPVDNEYAICPTVEDRCDPPFYHAHWSYEITFQKVK